MSNGTQPNGPGALTYEAVSGYRESFDSDPSKRLVQNVVTQHDVNDVALSRSIVTESPHSFSIVLDDGLSMKNMHKLLIILVTLSIVV